MSGPMAHWRLVVLSTQGGKYVQLNAQFFGADGTLLSTGGSASASSIYGPGWEADKAFNPGTEWCSVAYAFPSWLGYTLPSPAQVQFVRLQTSSASYWPSAAAHVRMESSPDGSTWQKHALGLVDGSWASSSPVLLQVAWLQGHAPPLPYLAAAPRPGRALGDQRLPAGVDASGTITDNNRVMVKADAAAPEVPMPGARVRLHRLIDGHCAWQGLSDAAGYYHAEGLEVGVLYYPVAIDLTGTHECDAAGPVLATKAA